MKNPAGRVLPAGSFGLASAVVSRQQLLAREPLDPLEPVAPVAPLLEVPLPAAPVPPIVLLFMPPPPVPLPLLLDPVLPLRPDDEDVVPVVLLVPDAVRPEPQGEVVDELDEGELLSVPELLAPGVVAEPELEVCATAAPPRARSAAAAEVRSSRLMQNLLHVVSPAAPGPPARATPDV